MCLAGQKESEEEGQKEEEEKEEEGEGKEETQEEETDDKQGKPASRVFLKVCAKSLLTTLLIMWSFGIVYQILKCKLNPLNKARSQEPCITQFSFFCFFVPASQFFCYIAFLILLLFGS